MDRSQLRLRLCLTNTNNILLHVVPRQDMIQANITNADTDMQVIAIGDDEGQEEDIHIHEDILIEEKGEEVFIQIGWKQRRTKIVLGVMLGIVVALAVAMGIYARDLASMEAQQKAMILTFGIYVLCHFLHTLHRYCGSGR